MLLILADQFHNLLEIIRNFDPMSSIRLFPRFDDPCVLTFVLLFDTFEYFFEFLKILITSNVLFLVLDMESKWQKLKDILVSALKVFLDIIEQRLFVRKMEIVLKMVMHHHLLNHAILMVHLEPFLFRV